MKKPPNQRPFVVTLSDVIGKDECEQLRQDFSALTVREEEE